MKLVVHVTVDNVTEERATQLYEEIKKTLSKNPELHINGQALVKFVGTHHTGQPGPPGEI